MANSIIIIGAGIAGLSTGCYAQMNGYRTQIFEMHDKPGGVCTAWKRKGYAFDGCIHNLQGTRPGTRIHQMWHELGATRLPFEQYEEFTQIESADGKTLTVYSDLDRLERRMKELAPADAKVIEAFVGAARRLVSAEPFDLMLSQPWEAVKLLPVLPTMMKWGSLSLEKLAERFSDPFLRQAIPCIQYDFAGVPTAVPLLFLSGLHKHDLGWPEGGSLAFAQAIARRYAELGGDMHYKARVEKVLVETNRAVGVRLTDGSEHRADIVISAADGYTTIFKMLDGKYTNEAIQAYYAAVPASQEMSVHVSLGVARDLSREPHALVVFLRQPFKAADIECSRLDVENYAYDPALAPAGKTALKVLFKSSYDYWKRLYDEDRERYDAEKQQLAQAVIAGLEQRFPGLTAQVEVVDVATPVTIERYTGNLHGYQAWTQPKSGPLAMLKSFTKTLPGLSGFYMVGQWAGAMIGVSTAAAAGRNLVKDICKRDRRRLVTVSSDADTHG